MISDFWIDSHAHMVSEGMIEFFEDFKRNALENNVRKVLIICGSLQQIEDALKYCENDPMFDLAIGVHPTSVQERTQIEFEQMMSYVTHPKVVAIGEIGLDYYWDQSYNDEQKAMFIQQIEVANNNSLPIIVHLRGAYQDLNEILSTYKVNKKGVIHCFSEGTQEAQELLDKGYYLGFGGILTFKNGQNVRDVLKMTPMDRVLTETDSPYLAPVPKRGKKNEPAFAMYVGEKLIELTGINKTELQTQIKDNYTKLFDKTKASY